MTMYRWSYVDTGDKEVIVYITDYEILLERWLWWSKEVFRVKPDNTFMITPDQCIEDYLVIHWAMEVLE